MPPSKNGCHNRTPFFGRTYPVQAGWDYTVGQDGTPTRTPIIEQHANLMEPDCQYSIRTTDDPGCDGCKWRAAPCK